MIQPVKILVVDDQSAIQSATCRTLEAAGYTTLAALEGKEALLLAHKHKPDLVLLNAGLPDISGFEVCKQIKADVRLHDIFVVLVSAQHTDSSSQSEALETGADGYITRPISNRELLARVQAMLRIQAAETALRKSEERFRTMTHFTQDWEYWIGPDREFIYISPSCETVCGYDAREFREDPEMLKKIVHPVDLPALEEHEEAFFESRQPGSLEMRIITRSGEVRWIQHICRPVYDAEGRWQGRRVSHRDITGRKQAEESLERQNRTLSFLQEIAQDIGGELDIATLLHNIMQRAVDLSRSDRGGGIYLYEADNQVLRLVGGAGINSERVGITVDVNEGVAGHVFRSARPLVVDNYTGWAERAEVLVASPPSTVMGIPLLIKGQVIGALTLIANSMKRTFTEEDTRLAGMFAAQASIAIHNAQLYGKAEHEIAERKQTEIILKESETRYRSLFENSGDAILLSAPDGKIYAANPAACRMFGRSEAEICRLGRDGVVDVRDPRLPVALETRQRKGSFSGELTFLRSGVQPFPAEINSTVFQEGGELRTSMIIRDISERKQAEEALRQSNAKLELLFEILPVGVSVLDQDNRVMKSNRAPEEILDLSIEDLQNKVYNHRRYLRPDGTDLPAEELPSRRVLSGEKVVTNQEVGVVKEDGSLLWTSVNAVASPFDDWRVVVVTNDITGFKRAQEELRESERRFRSIIENTPAGYFFIDRNGLWQQVNQAWLQMHGFASAEEVIGQHFSLTQVEQDLERANENVTGLIGGEAITAGEFSRRRKDGSIGYHLYSANPVVQGGEIIGLEGFIIDTTERKLAEEALRKSHERLRTLTFRLAQVEESQRRSIARELHDRVGQNLTALKINLNIIHSQLSEEDAQKIRPHMKDSIRLMEEIIDRVDDVLADLRPPLLEDYGLVAALRQYTEQFASRSGLRVEVLEPDKPFPRPSLDVETTLFRVAQEALNNVARYARASQVIIRLEPDRGLIRLVVRYDGQGFDPAQDAQAASGEKISGWELVSMRERIEAIGGTLQLTSGPGQGTQIVVEIPDLSPGALKGEQVSGL